MYSTDLSTFAPDLQANQRREHIICQAPQQKTVHTGLK